ncbi:HAD family hydrolase [Sulfurospirillum sp. 1307]|jgi:phosphoglycolate phosphatase
MYKAVIFDLDGTLLDTIEDLKISCNYVIEQFGIKPFSTSEYKLLVGKGAVQLFKDLLPNASEDDRKLALEMFEKHYAKQYSKNTKPYNDINKLLTFLQTKGIKIAVLSNKPHAFTKKCVLKYFNNWKFDAVYGVREGIPRKPSPEAVFEIMQELHVKPEETLFVGDTKVDMQTAKNANIDSVGVLWGFRSQKELEENGAKYIASNPKELIKILATL